RGQRRKEVPMSRLRIGACALLVLLVSDSVARGQERPAAKTAARRLAKVRHFRETTLSPDGRRVAWVETFRAKDGTSSAPSAIFLADLGPIAGKVRRLTVDEEPCTEHSLSWSPDGEQLV